MNIAAIILAAGYSSRMGVPKPLLPVGGVTALRRCVRLVRGVGVRTVIVVTGYRGDEVASAADDVIIAHNARFEDGMFSSIQCGAASLHGTDGFFLLPVDYCAVSPDTLTAQLRAFDGTAVVYPFRDGHRGHPPLIPTSLRDALLAYEGEGGLKGFLEPYPSVRLPTDDIGAYLDMDTPGDYAALLEHLGLPSYPDEAVCAALLAKYETPRDIIEHGGQVAEVAASIARHMTGAVVDSRLLRSACLLHDIARREPEHARRGSELLLREGYPRAAMLVAAHMDGPDGAGEVDEAALLFLADKLSRRGRTVPLERTLGELAARFSGDDKALRAAIRRMERADTILRGLFDRYGFGYEDLL